MSIGDHNKQFHQKLDEIYILSIVVHFLIQVQNGFGQLKYLRCRNHL